MSKTGPDMIAAMLLIGQKLKMNWGGNRFIILMNGSKKPLHGTKKMKSGGKMLRMVHIKNTTKSNMGNHDFFCYEDFGNGIRRTCRIVGRMTLKILIQFNGLNH